ncbi:ABC transporter permease [Paludibacterium purpuratum]|uniref:Thiamine transport system permease protein n=1 Tax=Paludibacterium purpuratum TaxID=1144873 RepID=A0A4R7BCT9_9NEIS|nr:iron ABC transporter permease [Paludibacterium purpuratum]TDR82890.1 thiamine transport system permease protein [Paludibacterium purpuratum]
MRSTRWLALLPLALLTALVAVPLSRLSTDGASALSLAFLSDPYYRWRLAWSLAQALATCGLALLFGLPIAWTLARFDFPGRRWLLRLLMLPFVMPTLVAAMGVLALFGPQGLTGIHGQDTPWLLLYGNLFYNLPLLVRSAQEGFARIPANRLMAARSLGATPWRVFWRVELPGAMPWICSALCLIFLYCFSAFGLALILGGQRYATVEVEIYTLVAYELNLSDASALALSVLAVASLVAFGYAWLERGLARPMRGQVAQRCVPSGWRQCALLALAVGLLVLLALAPLAAIAWRALWAGPAWRALADPEVWAALANTARFTALALGGACLFGLAHAFAARRSVLLGTLAFLPYAVSPVCVAFGLLLVYPRLSASLTLLIGAYTLLAYPFVARGMSATLDAVPAHLPQAARTLGASTWRVVWRVLLPIAAPALRRGMAFAAATALGEFAVTLFLSRPEWMTLTTLIYQRLGRPGALNQDSALVLSCLLMLLAMVAFVLIEWQREGDDDVAGR